MLVRHIPEVIVKEAERWPADLLVIGTHGRRGLNRFLLGSVADGVLRRSSVPVLLVRGKTPGRKLPRR
ncbi:MAG TPA: universal stress protein [Burkholderiales bacterium]|nr:universal stress protein [Burkholderiales bacterium]